MKKQFYFIFALLFSISSFAQTFSFEGLNYNVTGLTTVEVGLNLTASGDFTIPRTVTNGDNGISYTVTSISNDAFSGCFNLTTVFIHDSVVKIGDYAFYNCTSLVNVSIPNSVKDIGNYTFASCIGLTFVTIPNSVTEIGVSAFENCTSLTSVTIYDGLTEITALSFAGCTALPNLTIPSSVKSIGTAAFENCTSLNNITIPESVSKIGSSAFKRCIALTDIIIPSSVTIIDIETFQECTSLKNIIIPESITKIERRAFDQCTSLPSINIPSSVTSIIENAFRLCTGLKNITVNWETPLGVNLNIFSNTAIKDVALIVPNGKKDIYKETAVWKDFNPIVEPFVAPFTGQTFGTGGINYIVTKATSPFEVAVGNNRNFVGAAVIPENVNNYWNSFKVTSVSVEAFLKNSSNNGSLTSISLPNSVKSISNSAFYNCNLLTTLIFPPILESIGQDALNGCSSLTSLNIPSSLTSIADRAFFGCIGLQFVNVNWNIPLPINANVFGDVSLNNLELRIPIRTKDAYQAASVWRNFGTFSVPNAIKPGNGTLFTVNGINYIVTKDEAPYEVAIANNQEYSGDAVIPDLLNFEDNDFIVTSINVEAFNASDTGARLTSIRLPNSITTINEKAFYYAFYLKSINLPSNLAYIGRDAFSYCGLSSINIPSTVNDIGDSVFDNCGLLSSITVNWISPYDLLNGYVFDGLNLSDVNLIVPSGTLTVYQNAPVWGNFKTITEIDSLPVIGQKIIEEGVTYIITKNTLPYEVAVGNSTTSSAKVSDSSKNQKSSNISGALIIPSTIVSEDKTFIVTSIIPNGFINNIGITSVTIPKTIKSIGNDAFTNCKGIKFVNLDWATPLSINPTVFGNVNLGNVRLNVPPGKASVYDATPVWTDFNPIVAPAVPVLGQTFTFEGINYNITSATAPFTVEVGANGDTNLSDGIVAGFVGHANIPSFVENGGISYTVASIKFNAFYASHNLTAVTIPNTVTTIGFSAFRYTGLTSVTIPNSVTSIGIAAFGDCSQLTSVDISNSVTSIGASAFVGCTKLLTINIPSSVNSIESRAFYNCTALTTVNVNWTAPLPIDTSVFENVTLSNITLNVPAGTAALYDATAVWTDFNPIVEPAVPVLGQTFTFEGINYNITSATAPFTVEVGANGDTDPFDFIVAGFVGHANIPASVTNGGISYTVTRIGNNAFSDSPNLTTVTIPNTVTRIGINAFRGTGLTSVTISNSVTTIGAAAFYDCTQLTSVEMQNSVTSIENAAFGFCTSLPTINIPSSVTSIGVELFNFCTALTSVTVNWAIPLPINPDFFANVTLNNVTLNVPSGTTALYKAANVWKDFNIKLPDPATHLNFDGVNDYVVLPLNNTVIPTTNFTHEFWFQTTDLDGTLFTASTGNPTAQSGWDRSIYLENGKVSAYIFNGSLNTITSPLSYNDGNWHHLAQVVNATGSFLYVDGAVVASNTVAASVYNSNTEVVLGVSPLANGSYFEGNIDDVRIWNVAKTADQIAGSRNCEITGLESGLVAYYKCNQGFDAEPNTALTTLTDATANANHGTINGFALTGTTSNFLAGSPINTGVTVPTAPAAAAQNFTVASTVADLVPAPSATLKWYASATGGVALATNAPLASGNYYAAAVNSNGCESARTEVAVTVNLVAIGNTFRVDGINYIVTKATVTYEVAVSTHTSFKGAANIPAVVMNAGNSFAVTRIGNEAFFNCTGLTSVSIPNSVTSIGNSAFSYCSGLTSVSIPNSVTIIEAGAFSFCTGLTSVTIPNSVTSIGNSAFGICRSLTSVTIPSSVTSIGEFAFEATALTTVNIPSTVTTINGYAFYNCTGLTSVTVNWAIPLAINADVFSLVNLSNVTLNVPAGTASLYDATAVWTDFNPIAETIVPPALHQTFTVAGINYIVTKATLPYEVAVYTNNNFIGNANIPASVTNEGNLFTVTSIGANAFEDCLGLESLIIPSSVKSIGTGAFRNCYGLTTLSIPSSVLTIDPFAFSNCEYLTSVSISNLVTTIGQFAFEKCFNLRSVTVNWPTPLTITANVFDAITLANVTLNVPKGTAALYKAANVWKDFNIKLPDPATHLNFDGVNDYVVLPLNNIEIPTTNFTHEFWFQTTDSDGTLFTASTGNPTAQSGWDRSIYLENGKVSAYIFNGSLNTITSPLSYNDGNWHHVAQVVNATGSFLYIDGAVVASDTVVASTFNSNTEVVLGVSPLANGSYFAGNIDDVRIWNVAKTADEIARSKNCELAGNETGLLAYYKCNQGLDSDDNTAIFTITDAISSSNNGNLNNFERTGTTSNFLTGSVVTTGVTVPTAPTAASQTLSSGDTVAELVPAASATLKWYDVATGGTALDPTTALVTGNYYAAAVNSNGCESARTEVAVTVNLVALENIFTVDNINYIVTKATVPYEVAVYTHNNFVGAANIPASVTNAGNLFAVTSIGANAFKNRLGLTSVSISNSVTSIGANAFEDCFSLTSVSIPNSVTSIGFRTFKGCIRLTSVSIPNSVTIIEEEAFSSCTGLTSVTIPNSVTSIGKSTFGICTGLTSVTIPSSVTSIGILAFENTALTTVNIPSTVTTINEYAFYNCKALTSVTVNWAIPLPINPDVFANVTLNNVTLKVPAGKAALYKAANVWKDFTIIAPPAVGDTFAFEGINYIVTKATVPYEVAVGRNVVTGGSFGSGYVSGFVGIATIPTTVTNVGNSFSVTSIEDNAFDLAIELTGVNMPNTITSIGTRAFNGCRKLSSVNIPNGVTNIQNTTFSFCSALSSVSMPNTVTTIESNAFSYCSALKSITLSSSLITIDYDAFQRSGLTSIAIPNSVTNIGFSAFNACDALDTVTLPSSITNMDPFVFANCAALKTVTVNWAAPLSINANVFANVLLANVTLNVPKGTTAAYQAAPVWKDFNIKLPDPATHLSFDGSNDYVTLPTAIGNSLSNGTETTIEYWFKGTNLRSGVRFQTGQDFIVAGWGDTNPLFIVSTDGFINGVSCGPAATIQDNTWHHLAFVWKKNETFATYLDGALQNSRIAADVNLPVFNNVNGAIGVWLDGNAEFLNGNIDDVRIWNVAKSADEISRSKNCELAGNETGLLAYYKFNQGLDADNNTAITTLTDATANAYHGTFNGFALTGTTSNLLAGSPVTTGVTVPTAPTATAQTLAPGDTVAKLVPAPSATLKWYNVRTGGVALSTDTVLANGNYYAAAVNSNGCESARTEVAVNLVILPKVGDTFTFEKINYEVTKATLPYEVKVGLNGDPLPFDSTPLGFMGDATIPASVTNGGNAFAVTSIGNNAFDGARGMTSISLPNTIMSIGDRAFNWASGLTSFAIPESVTSIGTGSFASCTGFTTFTIPNSVTSIGDYAFTYCTALQSVTVGNSVTTIGSETFKFCRALSSVTLGTSVTSIGTSAFQQCENLPSITLPNSLITIGVDAFRFCFGLKSITIPNNVTSIAKTAFLQCIALTTVTIGTSVTSIGEAAFLGCTALKTVNVGWATPVAIVPDVFLNVTLANVTLNVPAGTADVYKAADVWKNFNIIAPPAIGDTFAFEGINYIVTKATLPYEVAVHTHTGFAGTANIPASVTNAGNSFAVTSIGVNAFYNCFGLTSVTIPNSVTSIGISAFGSCTGLTSVSIPNSVTIIGEYAFSFCTGLTSVTIPNSVTSIGISTFFNCSGLTSINIPSSVTSIRQSAFKDCTGLTSINIPSSVTSIGQFAFEECTGLTSVTVNWQTPLTITANVFETVTLSNVTLNVPAGTAAVYKAADVWKEFNPIMEPCNTPAPTAEAQILCNGSTVADLVSTGTGTIKWYNVAKDGVALESTTALATGTYYASTTVGVCESERTAVAVTVNTTAAPTAISPQIYAGTGTIANLTATGINLKWYSDATSISPLATDTALVDGTTYYVSQTTNSCESARTAVIIRRISGADLELCAPAVVSSLSPSPSEGFTAKWFTTPTAVLALFDSQSLSSGTYYVEQTQTTNTSNRVAVNVSINRSEAPTAAAQNFTVASTVANLVPAPSVFINWYDVATGGTALDPTTALVTGNYYVAAVTNGCESARTEVAVTVNLVVLPKIGDQFTAEGINYIVTKDTTPYEVAVDVHHTFVGAANIPELVTNTGFSFGVTSIANDAFRSNGQLTSVSIPNSVTSIGDFAFYSSRQITTVAIANSVTSIGEQAFAFCTKLSNVNIPNALTSVGQYAFNGCDITSITLPNTMTSISEGMFVNCDNLQSVTIPRSITNMGIYAFGSCTALKSFTVNWTTPITVLADVFFNVTLNNVTLNVPAGTAALYEAKAVWTDFNPIVEAVVPPFMSQTFIVNGIIYVVTKDTVPYEVAVGINTNVPSPAKVSNPNHKLLNSISGPLVIPATVVNDNFTFTVTSINANAFQNNIGINSVSIPNTVTSIGDFAFGSCLGITEVTVHWTTPIAVNGAAFYDLTLNTIALKVPTDTETDYLNALVWKDFKIGGTLGTENFAINNSLKLYPNPTSHVLNLSISNNKTIDKVIVSDMSGKKLLERNNETQIDVQNLANGMYLLEVFMGNKKEVSKFIKE
jgi:BspA type Leucine rich repeat region (6 copies)/Concanavalin A-like lectin/glucanases superfamily/Secretion system C-terminal sorting domain/Ig-like domain CHU_C associated